MLELDLDQYRGIKTLTDNILHFEDDLMGMFAEFNRSLEELLDQLDAECDQEIEIARDILNEELKKNVPAAAQKKAIVSVGRHHQTAAILRDMRQDYVEKEKFEAVTEFVTLEVQNMAMAMDSWATSAIESIESPKKLQWDKETKETYLSKNENLIKVLKSMIRCLKTSATPDDSSDEKLNKLKENNVANSLVWNLVEYVRSKRKSLPLIIEFHLALKRVVEALEDVALSIGQDPNA